MPRKTKTEETVVTEENILHENDMETENAPSVEETGMDEESSNTLSADADADFSAAEESTETAVPAEPISADEVSTEGDFGMTETLPFRKKPLLKMSMMVRIPFLLVTAQNLQRKPETLLKCHHPAEPHPGSLNRKQKLQLLMFPPLQRNLPRLPSLL